MSKANDYQKNLLECPDQEKFLLTNSALPSPRANLELLYAFIEISELVTVEKFLNKQYAIQPVNTPEEFVQCCAVSALGKHIVAGNDYLAARLKEHASDTRWRIRESVAMALQHIGKKSFVKLKVTIAGWENGNWYEQRAVAAGLCEPANLKDGEITRYTLDSLKTITNNVVSCRTTSDDSFKTLVQALCYCWSVAIVADPGYGKPLFEQMANSDNKTTIKIVKENLKKNRLSKMDDGWVQKISNTVNS